MKIYIHTYGRADKQLTWERLPRKLQQQATLVVQHRERALYATYPTIVLPPSIKTLSPTRQWIMEQHDVKRDGETLCLMDDDLREFAKRRTDNPTLFTQGTDADMLAVFGLLEKALKEYAHAGVLAREGANRVEESYLLATRMMRVLAYHVPTVRNAGARFDRVPCKQDFDMTLQLLRAGYPNWVTALYVQGQGGGSNSAGGCSTYRDSTMLDKTANTLHKLHPDFVKVVVKTTKGAWGGGDRTEVNIAWKKALTSSGYSLGAPRRLVK